MDRLHKGFMRCKYWQVVLFLVLLLASCTPQVTTDSSVIMTATPLILQTNCITHSSSEQKKIDGTIVFLDNWGQSILMTGENNLRIPDEFKGNNGNSEQSVSPNGSFLLYRQVKYEPAQSTNTVVVTSSGKVFLDFPDENKWISGIDWLSNEYIRYPIQSDTDSEQVELYTLNIQTGKLSKLRTDLPEIANNGSPDWGVDSWAIYFGIRKGINIVYDPTLSLVAYPKIRKPYPFYPVTIYDVQENVEITSLESDGNGIPEWSPDGKYFSIIGTEPETNIYIIPRDGGQLMTIPAIEKLYPKVNLGSYSWSPDSQHIAFWLGTSGDDLGNASYSLMILDLSTMTTTDLCIKGNGGNLPLGVETSNNLRGKPIWSPNSENLLITQYNANKQEVVVELIDLEQKLTYPIAINVEPIGWMK